MTIKELIRQLTDHTSNYDEEITIILLTLASNKRIKLDIHQTIKIFNTIEIQVK